MKNTKSTNLEISGRKEPTTSFSVRVPRGSASILRRTARQNRCTGADLLRTAWSEYIANHKLEG